MNKSQYILYKYVIIKYFKACGSNGKTMGSVTILKYPRIATIYYKEEIKMNP